MMDLGFALVIAFSATAVLVKEAGFQPGASEALEMTPQARALLTVAIDPNGIVRINRSEVEVDAVRPAVEKALRQNPQGPVLIQSHAGTPPTIKERVIRAVNEAGAVDVALLM